MTDETTNATEPNALSGRSARRKAKKPESPAAIGSTKSCPPDPRVAVPAVDERTGATSVRQRAARKSNASPQAVEMLQNGPVTPPSVNQPTKATKTEAALKALSRRRGACVAELQEITGWQAHSVRGFLSGTVKKKLGLLVISDVGKDGLRRYRIDAAAQDS